MPGRDTPQYRVLLKIAGDLRGLSSEWIVWALCNLLVNVLRHQYRSGTAALDRADELFARTRSLLATHYHPATGQRRDIVPPGPQTFQ